MSQQKQPQVIDLVIKYASDISSVLTNAMEMKVAGQHPDVFGHVIGALSHGSKIHATQWTGYVQIRRR